MKVRIYGTRGALVWEQEKPNTLEVSSLDAPRKTMSRGRDDLHDLASKDVRLPAGHPEGFYEAFSNIYSNFLSALQDRKTGEIVDPENYDYPDVTAGLQGVKFIETCLESSKRNGKWVDFD